jgi:thiol:disulfide interchange protein DsbC
MPIQRLRVVSAFAAIAVFSAGVAFAQTLHTAPVIPAAKPAPATTTTTPADPRATIAKKIDGLKADDVRISPINGVYEIANGSQIGYASADGKYVILGDLIDMDSKSNLSETRRRGIRARLIETVPETEMMVFSPKDPKYTITVFTDIDCGYCRRLHSQIGEYNRLGIRVRYLFYPRTGPNTDSWHKAEAVWCSSNRNDALTRAKNGEAIKAPNCAADSIIARDYELGHKLDVDGTPAIFLASGEMLPGYSPPGQLLKYLKTGQM